MTYFKIKLLLIVILGLSVNPVHQVFAKSPDDYRIGKGDILHITVWQEKDMERNVTVSPEGKIDYPLIGQVRAAGLTATQLSKKITRLLGRDYFVKPQVTVEIKEYRSQKIYVLGQVDNPGLYYLKGKTSLLEMISQAGGITELASKRLLIIRAAAGYIKSGKDMDELLNKSKTDEIDLHALLVEGDLSFNRFLKPEDVIFVPSRGRAADHNIYVMGAIKRPGAYEYKDGLTALNACIIAGGFTEVAAPNRAEVSRLGGDNEREIIRLNLDKVKAGRLLDSHLEPGDRIFIPESYF